MPPKPRFTREEIVAAALDIVSRKGIEALTARELGETLSSSARPIFTVFRSMEELQQEVRSAAMHRFESYAGRTMPGVPLFKQVGMQMVLFGAQEPKLYQLLFMRENRSAVSFDDVFGELGDTVERCIEAVCRDYDLSPAQARVLFEHVWIYTSGWPPPTESRCARAFRVRRWRSFWRRMASAFASCSRPRTFRKTPSTQRVRS